MLRSNELKKTQLKVQEQEKFAELKTEKSYEKIVLFYKEHQDAEISNFLKQFPHTEGTDINPCVYIYP